MAFEDQGFSDGGVLSVLGLNAIIAFAVLTGISLLRRRKFFRPMYEARLDPNNPTSKKVVLKGVGSPVPPLVSGFYTWIVSGFQFKDEDIMAKAGLEPLLMLKFEKAMLCLLVVVAVLCACILMPVNDSGSYNLENAIQNELPYTSGFNNWTSNNIGPKSSKLWAHFVVFLIISSLLAYTLWSLARTFAVDRAKFLQLKQDELSVRASSVLLHGVSKDLRQPEQLKQQVEAITGKGSVYQAYICHDLESLISDTKDMQGLEQDRLRFTNLWMHYRDQQHDLDQSEKDREKAGEKLKKYREKLDKTEDKIQKKQTKLDRAFEQCRDWDTTGYAIITFHDAKTARGFVQQYKGAVANRLEQLEQKGDRSRPPGTENWDASTAPKPDALLWDNLGISPATKVVRQIGARAAYWWLVLFWSIPVTFLGSLRSLATIQGIGPAFESLLDLPAPVLNFLEAYLPVIVVAVFNMLLPAFITWFALMQGEIRKPRVLMLSMRRFFIFQLFATVILPTIFIGSLSVLKQLIDEIADDPFSQIMSLLAKITAPQSGFFIAYLISAGLTKSFVSLLRVGPLITRPLKMKVATTRADREEVDLVEEFLYWLHFPVLLLGLTIVFLFSITMPFTTIFGLLFALVYFVVDRYRLVYMHPAYDHTEGQLFGTAIKCMYAVLIIFTFAVAAMFAGKEVPVQFGLSIAIFAVTALSYYFFAKAVNASLKRNVDPHAKGYPPLPMVYWDLVPRFISQQHQAQDHSPYAYAPSTPLPLAGGDPMDQSLKEKENPLTRTVVQNTATAPPDDGLGGGGGDGHGGPSADSSAAQPASLMSLSLANRGVGKEEKQREIREQKRHGGQEYEQDYPWQYAYLPPPVLWLKAAPERQRELEEARKHDQGLMGVQVQDMKGHDAASGKFMPAAQARSEQYRFDSSHQQPTIVAMDPSGPVGLSGKHEK